MRISSWVSLLSILLTTVFLFNQPNVSGQEIKPLSFVSPDSESYVFDLQWGGYGSLNDEFYSPEGIAVDLVGNIWIADTNNHRIMKFDASGNFLFSFGAYGGGDGQLNTPHGIAIDRRGNVWVADTNNNRVQKFSNTGVFLGKVTGLTQPHGIGTHPTLDIAYVANTGANGIVKVNTSTCANIGGWGGYGSGDGEFNYPHDVAVDRLGKVYIADYNNHRIQVFNSTGKLLIKWGTYGTGDSRFTASPQFYGPVGVEIDACGDVFVVDHNNHRVQKFTSTGVFITMWGWNGYGNGQFNYPVGIAIDGRGRVFVLDRNNHRVERFSASNNDLTYLFKQKWGSYGSLDSQFSSPADIAVNPTTGEVYVADIYNHRIQVFNAAGVFQRKWGAYGSSNGQFYYPQGVAVDPVNGEVYIADTYNHRIQVFNAAGVFQRGWGASGNLNGLFAYPTGIAVDHDAGVVYVADTNNHRIQMFTTAGVFTRGIGQGVSWTGVAPSPSSSNLNGWFYYPRGVAVNNGNIYVADSSNHRVQKFNTNGVFQTKWGLYGSGNGQLNYPSDIDVDDNGNVYVVERDNHRIQKFNQNGRFITKWSSYGNLDGLHSSPLGIAVDGTNDFIYISDTNNHRIQRFERFGFSFVITPSTRTIVKGDVATYTLTLNGVGPNTLSTDVSFCLLSGRPNATTVNFSPASVQPNSSGAVTSTLSFDTSGTTTAKTYTFYIEAKGGGQTRVRSRTLKVTNPPE